MGRGIIKLPLEEGRKELAWYAGRAIVNGTNQLSPVVPLKVERDADFVAKRLFLVQWPTFGAGNDPTLALPPQTTVTLRDGTTKRGLSLVPQGARNIMDADPVKMTAAFLGLPSPYLIKANNYIYAEVNNPGAAGTPWVGDLYLVAEGFKVYPHQAEEFPATITQYSVPFAMNANAVVNDPSVAQQNIAGQFVTITNNGEGKFLAKAMKFKIIDAAGVDRTAALANKLAFAITDSTSGNKRWNQDTSSDATYPLVPSALLTMGFTFLPFNTPRYIDPNGVIQIQVIFSAIAGALAEVHAAATWPVSLEVELYGSLLPR